MNKLRLISLFTLSFLTITCYGQLLRDHDVDESTVKPWIEDSISKYSDRYIFQPNDGNYLIIVVDDTNVSAQIHFPAHWTEGGYALELGIADSSEVETHSEYVTLSGVKISDGKFYSDQYKGEFVTFVSDTIYHGIKVYDSWSIWEGYKYEIGVKRQENLMKIYNGKYPEASLKILDSAYVASISKDELKIIRNEIYGRYNYRFKEGGELEKYFSQQQWYISSAARYSSVQHMLTWIELRNIELIKNIEKIK
jgi:hypothetical protein